MLGTKLGQNCDKWDKWDNWDKWDKSGTNGTNLGQMGQNQFFVTGVWRAQTPSVCDHAKKRKKIFKHGPGPRPLSKNLGQNWDKTGTNGTKLGQMGQMGQTGQNWDKWDKSWDKWDNLGQMETKPGTPRRNQNVGADDPGCLRLTGLSCAAQTATSENNVCSAEVPGASPQLSGSRPRRRHPFIRQDNNHIYHLVLRNDRQTDPSRRRHARKK